MIFNSVVFVFLYLPSFLIIYFLLPGRWRNAFLFFASLFFYFWSEGLVVFILLLSAVINFFAGKLIERGLRQTGLWLSLLGSLSLLVYYKYANFLFSLVQDGAKLVRVPGADEMSLAHIMLPIGISFYTFQGISYTLDVYWGRIKANRSFLDYGAYVAMFPHQIAGPIVRYADIAPELTIRIVTIERFGMGAERFIIGLAKKTLLANTFAGIADPIFNAPLTSYTTPTAWLGIISYSLQIYFDFSGYSDMAIGLGKMIGFDFKENFNYPYTARSIQDFWHRWHISLSGWFRDYLYIPLGGNRGSKFRTYRNLLIVFFVTGLWHGASWNFIVWGLYHGAFLLFERAGLRQKLERIWPPVAHVYTLLVVLIGWVFFRAENLSDALGYLAKMAGFGTNQSVDAIVLSNLLTIEAIVTLALGLLFTMPVYYRFQQLWLRQSTYFQSWLISDSLYAMGLLVLFVITIMYIAPDTYNPFIYFRF